MAHHICKSGDTSLLKYFKSKSTPDQMKKMMTFVDENGQNCLHMAVARGHRDMVKEVLEGQEL